MVVHPRFDPGAYMADIARHQAAVFGGAPTLFQAMLNHPDLGEHDFSNVRYVASGAAPLPVELLTAMQRVIPHAIIMEAYGFTEMTTTTGCSAQAKSERYACGGPR
jgi:long-chain acyl-CoA synthetase